MLTLIEQEGRYFGDLILTCLLTDEMIFDAFALSVWPKKRPTFAFYSNCTVLKKYPILRVFQFNILLKCVKIIEFRLKYNISIVFKFYRI